MFVVGRSGNKSLDELVEADPDPTRKENTARKEAGKREQRKKSSHELAQGGGKEKEYSKGTGWEWKDSEYLYLVTLFVTERRTREAAGVSRNRF